MKVKFNRITPWPLAALFAVCMALPLLAQAAEITVGKASHHDTSVPMSNVVPLDAVGPVGKKEVPLLERVETGRFPDLAEPDGGLQSQSSPARQLAPTPGFIVSAPGLSEQDNRDVLGFSIVPPDINGDIGLDDAGNRIYIQYINSVWGVFDVNGNLINGPFAGNTFWTGFGGPCETNNDGDPVVLYDDEAGQWLFSQFSINQGVQCVAISTTSNPLGPYHRYAFEVTPGGANDYPKLGVWSDGTTGSTGQSAYTFTTRDFPVGSTFGGAGVMERDAMLVGAPAQFIKFSNPCVAGDCVEGQLPPHLAGPNPPVGTCPTFWTAVDSAFDDSPFANDGYRNHTLCVDWSNLGNTTYTEGPLVVAGSNFDRFLAGNVVGPVNGGEDLDALQFFTMNRVQYRWFGTYGSVVFNTTVDAGSDRAGIRWTENRSTDGDSGWFRQQDGTYAGDSDDGIERWMGSIAQDQDGNIALGYTAASGSLFPSVRYTTRMAGDAPGAMPGGEASCHESTGAQVASSNRWGDYSSMSIDPTDDCTFWYTQEYYETTGSFDFNTRICSFKLDGCGGPPSGCTADTDCDNGSFCDGAETCNVSTGICEDGTPPSCEDDGLFCNGAEACNEETDSCAGAPPVCDDALFCNGEETCNEGTDSCDAGTPPVADDGVGCTDDSCNETTNSIDNVPNNGSCDDGLFCNGAETCDATLDCQPASNPCLDSCDETNDVCIGCGDGTCDPGEDCNSCAADCISGDLPGAVCGNDLCEAGDSENGVNCPADCNSKLNGKPSNRFSCGDGDGYAPIGCGDSRCTSGGFACTEVPVESGSFCCGDSFCEGDEDIASCELDCTPPDPFCGDNITNTVNEACDGTDLGGETCASQGFIGGTLSCLSDCSDFNINECNNDEVCVPTHSKEKGPRCSDGIDNDCDGDIDGADSDC